MQLTAKLLDPKHRTEWLVITLPKGEVLSFRFSDRNWATNQNEKINDEFAKAIGHVISPLSIQQQAKKRYGQVF